jgi:uncharacterized membrane protein
MAEFLQTDLGKTLYTFLIAMLPVVELRGSIPVAAASGLPWPVAMTASVLGNMLPVPFILLFVRRVFRWLKDHNKFAKFV